LLLHEDGGGVDQVAFGDGEMAAVAADGGAACDCDRVDVSQIGVLFEEVDDGGADAGRVDRDHVSRYERQADQPAGDVADEGPVPVARHSEGMGLRTARHQWTRLQWTAGRESGPVWGTSVTVG
jgi:hypothetical protein